MVAVSEYVPYNDYFYLQGYALHKKVLYHDNESSTKMKKIGRNSCTGNSMHISIRFFLVKDHVDK